ncbi:MAG: hypothetical protein JXR10_09535 [Cyclobacteriaceae bacterium]
MNFRKAVFSLLLVTLFSQLNAQTKVTEKFLLGTWDLTIDIDEELKEMEDEARETESLFESVILNTVSGAVSGLLNRLDISLEFRKGGEVKVVVEAFGERETEYTEWSIDSRGRLHIEDSDSFSTDLSDLWMRDGNVLVLINEDDDDKTEVYMRKVD